MCCNRIVEQKQKMLCINDNELLEGFELIKERVKAAFESILPKKSTYER